MNEPTIQDLKQEMTEFKKEVAFQIDLLMTEIEAKTSTVTVVVWIEALLIGFLLARELL